MELIGDNPGLGRRAAERVYRAGLAIARRSRRATRVAGARVISIGNLEVGGTGKTPCVLWCARTLAGRSSAVAVVCRPWGPPVPGAPGDEAAMLAEILPRSVRLYTATRKLDGAQQAARQGAEVVLIDDGFSHRNLARDLDLVLVDARRPFGNGHCLPAGTLREPASSLARADAVVLSRADRASASELDASRAAIRATGFSGPVLLAKHQVKGIREHDSVRPLAGETVFCVSGLARAGELAEAASRAGLKVVGQAPYPDHHAFGAREWECARDEAARLGARILVTAKDAVRLDAERRADVLVLEMEWEWLESDVDPEALLARAAALQDGKR